MSIAPGHKWYVKFDIDSAFHLVPVRQQDRHKTAFVSSLGLFEWNVMPFGLKNAPATFQRMIDSTVRGFLGVVGYYREFMPRYSEIALPLTDLTKDDAPASHSELPPSAFHAFRQIQEYWANPQNLAPYDPSKPVHLVTDASSQAWAAVIEQGGRPLAFLSGKFTESERKWGTTDRELFACLQAHKKMPHLLQGDTTWWTDHKALESLKTTLANSLARDP